MDHRRRPLRFVPMSDNLESKQLLTTLLPTSKTTAVDTTPNTLELKQQRIDRLPYYLNLISPGRQIPNALIVPLQADMNAIIGKLRPPGSSVLAAFNHELRKGQSTLTVSREDAQTLNAAFGSVLTHAEASPTQVTNLQNDLQSLTKFNTDSASPGFVTTNDYSTVLQTALGVGKPYSLTNVSVGNPVKNHNGLLTSQVSIQVMSNGFNSPSVTHPTPTGSVELHEVLTSTVPGHTTQTKTSLLKTVTLTAAAPRGTGNSFQTQAVYSGTINYKPVASETISFFAKYKGDGKFTASTSTTVFPG